MYDYGFELPDVRDEYICKDGATIKILINRHWGYGQYDEDEEPTFQVSFDIIRKDELHGQEVTHLPIGTREEQACEIARKLYEEDEEESQAIYEMRAEEAAERRMGA